eukprot:1909555-Pyramimonas_sp.AAC.1
MFIYLFITHRWEALLTAERGPRRQHLVRHLRRNHHLYRVGRAEPASQGTPHSACEPPEALRAVAVARHCHALRVRNLSGRAQAPLALELVPGA